MRNILLNICAVLTVAQIGAPNSSGMALAIILQTASFFAVASARVKLDFPIIDLFDFIQKSSWVFGGQFLKKVVSNIWEFDVVVAVITWTTLVTITLARKTVAVQFLHFDLLQLHPPVTIISPRICGVWKLGWALRSDFGLWFEILRSERKVLLKWLMFILWEFSSSGFSISMAINAPGSTGASNRLLLSFDWSSLLLGRGLNQTRGWLLFSSSICYFDCHLRFDPWWEMPVWVLFGETNFENQELFRKACQFRCNRQFPNRWLFFRRLHFCPWSFLCWSFCWTNTILNVAWKIQNICWWKVRDDW